MSMNWPGEAWVEERTHSKEGTWYLVELAINISWIYEKRKWLSVTMEGQGHTWVIQGQERNTKLV